MILEIVAFAAVGAFCQIVGFKVANKINNEKQKLLHEKEKELSDNLLAANQLLEEELANKTQIALDITQDKHSKSELINLLLASPDLRKDAIDVIRKEIKEEIKPEGGINFVYRHKWKHVSLDQYESLVTRGQTDTFEITQCTKCRMQSKQWHTGWFTSPQAGYFRGGQKVMDLQQQMFCCFPDEEQNKNK